MFVCKYCSRKLSSDGFLKRHEKACVKNPNRVQEHFHSAEKRQLIAEAGRGRVTPQAVKDKISASRIKFLKENPDQVPYLLNHYTNGESYPESYWRKVFENANLAFNQELQLGIYRLDFAFNSKVNIEIDGEQHYTDARILKSNQRRDKELTDAGWIVHRIRWSHYQKLSDIDKEKFIAMILNMVVTHD